MATAADWIRQFEAVHGDRYDYSDVRILTDIKAKSKISIICREHGPFLQTSISHRSGSNCPKCARNTKRTKEDYIEELQQIHGGAYGYELWLADPATYTSTSSIVVTCPHHGPWTTALHNHRSGTGCPKCRSESRRVSKDEWLTRFAAAHGDRYDYSLWTSGEFTQATKIQIVCTVHGAFEQSIEKHAAGSGCSVCVDKHRKPKEVYVEAFREAHDFKYDYSEWTNADCEYRAKTKIAIECPTHGTFHQAIDDHARGHGCPKCPKTGTSAGEQDLAEFVKSCGVAISVNNRSIIGPQELDIVIESHKLAIEYCGLYWHCDAHDRMTPRYHKQKMLAAEAAGYRLLTIFEDEWHQRRPQVEEKIRSILNASNQPTTFARKCKVVAMSVEDKRQFFDANHIQGNGPGSLTYGLQHDGVVVAAMTFIEKAGGRWDLNRYATSQRVPGGFSKLLTWFTRHHNWTQIISFADRRWSVGNMYEVNGFTVDCELPPDYQYVPKGSTSRVHKFNYRRRFLPRLLGAAFDPNLSEVENTRRAGCYRIFNCGLLRYQMTNTKKGP